MFATLGRKIKASATLFPVALRTTALSAHTTTLDFEKQIFMQVTTTCRKFTSNCTYKRITYVFVWSTSECKFAQIWRFALEFTPLSGTLCGRKRVFKQLARKLEQ
jgi:hypothetical protein